MALRIALTADPELAVPPQLYGGIERIVDMLAHGLVARGHDVTLFANSDSVSAGHLIPWAGRSSRSPSDTARNAATLARAVLGGQFDLIHSFSRIAYLTPILPLPIPKLMTYQREITRRSVRMGLALSRGTLDFTSISRHLMREVADLGTWHLAYNGVPLDTYKFNPDPGLDAPLVFLGRIEKIKGPHIAIEVARLTGIPLIIAGNVPPEHRDFFAAEIAPRIDGAHIKYVGAVDDTSKNAVLGQARALLMPVVWDEPFGIVMAEAMACGTPIIGLARGAVPEVVEHGVTGYVAGDVEGLASAIAKLGAIDRAACRARVERLFSDAAVTDGYLAIYAKILSGREGRKVA
jgi:glycosyltransferase involved in cell wall biosynthesis